MAEVTTVDEEGLPRVRKATRDGHRRRKSRVLRIIGLLLILAAVAVGGYAWWTLWGTGFATNAAQNDLRPAFEERIASRPAAEAPPRTVNVPGSAVAILRIPKIELNYVVVEGTDTESLKKGPGHYPWTSYPWEETGRVAIAGHRTTYGAPFWSLDEMKPGDRIVLATEFGIFNYRVTESRIIPPSQAAVLHETENPTLVLTTCNPRFSAAERLIVFAERIG
ncbi:MAG: sortase [Actinomycetota bacterium]